MNVPHITNVIVILLLKTHQIVPLYLKWSPYFFSWSLRPSYLVRPHQVLPGDFLQLQRTFANFESHLILSFHPHYAFPHAFSLSLYPTPSQTWTLGVCPNSCHSVCDWFPLILQSELKYHLLRYTFSIWIIQKGPPLFSLSKYPASFVALITICYSFKNVLTQLISLLDVRLWLSCKLPEGRGCVRLPQLYM